MGIGKALKFIMTPPPVHINKAVRNIRKNQKEKLVKEFEEQAGRKLDELEIEEMLPKSLKDINENGKKVKPLTSDTNEKILKALGKQARREWDNAEHISAGVEVVANKMAKSMFKKVDYEETGDAVTDFVNKMNHPTGYVMKMGPTLAIPAVALAFSMGDTAMQVKNRNHMGKISSGEMANMVSKTRSPGIYDDKQMAELGKPRRNPYNNHGAEGDIVFALHNLR